MGIAEKFAVAVRNACEDVDDGADLLPMLLARACVKVLPVAGAGLSMTDELRVPLGASDATAARAERLQVTLGEGPCLEALAASEPQVYDYDTIASRWPVFFHELQEQTPYRSAASVPLRSPDLPRFGALDLFSTDSAAPSIQMVEEVADGIADAIAGVLFAAPTATYQHGIPLPTWLNVSSVTHRMNVWVAVGMLMEHTELTNADALAVMRAHAFSHELTLDQVAQQITQRELAPVVLLP